MGNSKQRYFIKYLTCQWNISNYHSSTVTPIYKKDSRSYNNYRKITLNCVPGKIYSRFLNERLSEYTHQIMDKIQWGVRSQRGT